MWALFHVLFKACSCVMVCLDREGLSLSVAIALYVLCRRCILVVYAIFYLKDDYILDPMSLKVID